MSEPAKMENPTECDIVMEGGVTSGVVYPSFVAGLARHFTLPCIGGTSVGAVAAVVAVVAQPLSFAGMRRGRKTDSSNSPDCPAG